ncbi:hypothetical protein EDD36DRAFT_54949 [Exophiala viscosa]|uniref:Uncharacterized protein n=1 Tax=Exophiala viscosa TaxID=2486360 RepID=A0AAN6IAE5_9EURO|nr:hypothetical protein EDD36DRAFT_54949 [Exophiala viscosa]
MKMLSRANVPTVEAGSFPVQRPQFVPQTAPPALLTPNDSASQIGSQQEDPKTRDQAGAFPQVASTTRHLQSAVPARPAMGPPASRPSTMDAMQYRPLKESSTFGLPQTRQNLAPRSNVSLSTATTLVNSKVNFTVQDNSAAHHAYGNAMNMQHELGRPGTNTIKHPTTNPVDMQDDMQDPGLGLPPKRTLPFRRSDSTADEYLASAVATEATSINEKNELGHLPAASEKQEVIVDPVCSPQAKGKRKRAPAKTSTAKKPRATNTRKKAGNKAAEDNQPIPTVEDLLKQPDRPLFQRMVHQNAETKHLEISDSEPRSTRRAGGSMGSPSLGAPSRRVTRSASRALVPIQDQSIVQNGTDTDRTKGFPCTPADQMIVPVMPGSPEAQHSCNAPSPQDRPPRSGQDIPQSSFACADLKPMAEQPDVPIHQVMPAPDGLHADADIAGEFQRLQAWANQPDGVRSAALKSYFCRLIMDESFGRVCKSLDSWWETEIMKGKIERRH